MSSSSHERTHCRPRPGVQTRHRRHPQYPSEPGHRGIAGAQSGHHRLRPAQPTRCASGSRTSNTRTAPRTHSQTLPVRSSSPTRTSSTRWPSLSSWTVGMSSSAAKALLAGCSDFEQTRLRCKESHTIKHDRCGRDWGSESESPLFVALPCINSVE